MDNVEKLWRKKKHTHTLSGLVYSRFVHFYAGLHILLLLKLTTGFAG